MRENLLQIELLSRLREDTWEAALQRRERLAQAGTWLGSSRQDCRSSRKTRSERLQIDARYLEAVERVFKLSTRTPHDTRRATPPLVIER